MAIRTSRTAAAVNTGYGDFMDQHTFLDNYTNAALHGGKVKGVPPFGLKKGSPEAKKYMAFLRSRRGIPKKGDTITKKYMDFLRKQQKRYGKSGKNLEGGFDLSAVTGALGPIFQNVMGALGGPAGVAKMGATVGLPLITGLVQKIFKKKDPALKAAIKKAKELEKALNLLKDTDPDKYAIALKNPKVKSILELPGELEMMSGSDSNPMIGNIAQMIFSQIQQQQQQGGQPSFPQMPQMPQMPYGMPYGMPQATY